MPIVLAAFISGVLTILAPCILPILPIILSGSSQEKNQKKYNLRPYIVIVSFLVSVFIFTIIIQMIANFLFIPNLFLRWFSGSILLLMGLNLLFPKIWPALISKLKLFFQKLFPNKKSTKVVEEKNENASDLFQTILTGFSLGPLFSSCSPTFGFIIVIMVYEGNFWRGLVYSLAYIIGLGIMLILVNLLGLKIIKKVRQFRKKSFYIKEISGVIFIIVGLSVLFQFDKTLEILMLESGYYDPILEIENKLIPRR